MEKFISDITYKAVDFDPFGGPAIERTVPSTEAQREVFVASLMGPEASCAYNESVSLELTGELDVARMEQVIAQLVARHESLRCRMSADGLRIIVLEHEDIKHPFIDLTGKNAIEQQRELDAFAERDMTTAFDLLNGPVFRTVIIKLAIDKHLLRLTGHHLVCDGWSLGIIMADISKLYNGDPLEAAVPFSDYAMAQLDFEQSAAQAEVERYWLDTFKGTLPRVDLPTDRPRPQQKTFSSRRIDMEMDPGLVRRLRETATRTGTSLVTTLLTCFELLVYRLTGDGDMCIGLPAAGQNDFGMKNLVGHCVNLLALRSRVDDERPFAEHLKERRSTMLDVSDHQKYTFGTLVRKLNVPREPGRVPLVPVVFNIDMNMDDGVAFKGLTHRLVSNPRRFENFELFLNIVGRRDGGMGIEAQYNTDLFDDATIRRWLGLYETLMHSAMDDLSRPVGQLALLPSSELQALAALQPTPVPAEGVPLMHAGFTRQAKATPERAALRSGRERMSYRELDERSNQLAHALRTRGIGRGQHVGLCLDRGIDMMVALLAVLKSGAAYVPLDPGFPQARLDYYAEDARLALLLTDSRVTSAPRAWCVDAEKRVLLMDRDTAWRSGPVDVLAPDAKLDAGPEDAAYVIYTSGSTGKPKGVRLPHRAVANFLWSMRHEPGITAEDRLVAVTTLSFDIAVLELMLPLYNGAEVILADRDTAMDGERLSALLSESRATMMQATPATWRVLVDAGWRGTPGFRALCGGEGLPATLAKAILERSTELWNMYGPTETTIWSTCTRVEHPERGIHIGRPIANTTVWILDAHDQPTPSGVPGEICIGGEGVALGYLDRPELTAERFVTLPINGVDTLLYRTGDRGRWRNDGTLEHLGRLDFQVKVRGYRIELGEIEARCSEAAGVGRCVVITREDQPGDVRLATYLVLSEPARYDQAALRKHLGATLPQYMVPQHIVVLDELPLLPNGKIDRKALPKPESDQRATRTVQEHQGPRDAIEQTLTSIWSTALGVDKISINDDFFDLGGHSLIGIQVLSNTEQQLGRKLSLSTLFQAPTIARFAEAIRGLETVEGPRYLAAIQKEGGRIPLFCVHGDEATYFLPRELGNDQPFYGFFHQGEDGHPIPYRTVEDIAAHFISEMREVRPHGPYLLCGFSFGGLVAYEMAQQLTRKGEDVPFLALLDTYAPGLYIDVTRDEHRWYWPLRDLVMRRLVRWHHRRGKILPPKLRHYHIIDTYDKAIRKYAIKPYNGTMLMLKAQDSPGPGHMGWKDLVRGGLRVETTPGDHFNLIKEPHVRTLAKIIERSVSQTMESSLAQAV
ncbi:MAG TPA: amino acid adenylation domain-containing protein [Flavobacteriales bacterium]|nr:amino acid adenylation domain-containing protein [Flavobacteriales bacterium]HMU14312.1 amino acid adenylation domain-containing protein [Flavobacteriales bacterium]HNE79723.1 amino acid adenylation domain-containing protein [Flavobacteriales bacterium]HNK39690.1 amino acid adenylation domain-containing protein [Flavobacteriales bacterium]HNK68735.1 amino acid adenylation domain-containing protein [Flavobacteriales bacterium]